jgi:hypothetical protein
LIYGNALTRISKLLRSSGAVNKENIMSVKDSFIKKKVAKNFNDDGETSYKFKNELGSIMEIDVPSNGGLMTGTYRSKVGSPNNSNSLTGFTSPSGNIVSFTVNYKQEGSIAAWVGQTIWNSSSNLWEIHTLWHLVEPKPPADMWDDTYAGCDIFTQVTL